MVFNETAYRAGFRSSCGVMMIVANIINCGILSPFIKYSKYEVGGPVSSAGILFLILSGNCSGTYKL
jgi:hypothetical protein